MKLLLSLNLKKRFLKVSAFSNQKVVISSSTENIMAWNYFKIDETGDLSYLNIFYDEFGDNVALSGEYYEEVWSKIKKDFTDRTVNGEVENNLKNHSDIVKIQVKMHVVSLLKELYIETINKEPVKKMLKEWGVNISGSFFSDLEAIDSFILINKNMLKIAEKKIQKEEEENEKASMYKVKLFLETSLEKNDIDLKKTNMAYFAEMLNAARKKSERHGKQV